MKSNLECFIGGALLGIGLGMIFAPKKGSETREDIMNVCSSLIDKTEKKMKNKD